uniref:Amidase domain-containing protein n=1 Tax=Rhabditophanes sp. KR3021 TaxID=114890 RepID=A0AC35UBP9_9BILA
MGFLRTFSPLIYFAFGLYFQFINVAFWIYNHFKKFENVTKPADNTLLLISATQAAAEIREKRLSSSELVEAYIERIASVNPIINAVVVPLFEQARKMAQECDDYLDCVDVESDEYKNLAATKPLYGIPFTLKDSISVKGSILCCGMDYRKGMVMEKDALVVSRMKEAGAIPLCVTNVPECAMWWESVNTVYGRTNNCYDSRRICGGSSGGEGALIGAAGSLIGLGSDIGGSIRMPAFFNGVFGMKPTIGVVPSDGHFPEAVGFRTEMFTIGPMCRYATDLPLMLSVLAGPESANLKLDIPINIRKTKIFYMVGLKNPAIESLDDNMAETLRKAVKYFEKKYDIMTYQVDFPTAHRAAEHFFSSMEVKGSDKFDKILTGGVGTLNIAQEIMKGFMGKSVYTLPALMTAFLDNVETISEPNKQKLFTQRDQLKKEIINLLGEDGILIFPSFPTVAPFHNQPIATPFNFAYTALWNAVGLPVVQCPMGLNKSLLNPAGMPLGVQIIGSPNSDGLLIQIAADLEEGFGGWELAR